MKKYILLILAILLPLTFAFIYFAFYKTDSAASWSGGQCTFREITGLECPGCGGQRTLYHLLHGNILEALRHNAFFVIAFPFALYFYYNCLQVYILKKEKYLDSFVFKPIFGYSLLIIIILFFILRNIPIAPFSYLAPPN